ncbi:MAG TPA: hypothetical protein VKA68_16570 [bacterium]|nr:hypothetical protein [bacterium]
MWSHEPNLGSISEAFVAGLPQRMWHPEPRFSGVRDLYQKSLGVVACLWVRDAFGAHPWSPRPREWRSQALISPVEIPHLLDCEDSG